MIPYDLSYCNFCNAMLQVIMYAVQPFKKNRLKQNTEECKKQATSVIVVKAVPQGGYIKIKIIPGSEKAIYILSVGRSFEINYKKLSV